MRVIRVLGKSLLTTLVFFLLVEVGLRAAYAGRNALVRYVPLPYVVGDDYGPIPPWLDNLLILRPDPTLHLGMRTFQETRIALTSTSLHARSGALIAIAIIALLRRFLAVAAAGVPREPSCGAVQALNHEGHFAAFFRPFCARR